VGDDKIVIEIDAETGAITTKVGGVTQAIENIEKSSESASLSMAKGFLGAELAMKGLELATMAVEKAIDMIKESIADAAKNEVQIQKLNLALSNAGQYSKEASNHFVELAESIGKTTAYSADSVLQIEAMARNYAISNEETEKLTKASVELAAATGISLDSAVQRLGMSMSGFSTHLQRLIPGVEKLSSEQLRHGQALDFVLSKYSGTAAESVNTFAGRMTLLNHAFEASNEVRGKMITDSPIINKAIEEITNLIRSATERMEEFSKSGKFEEFLRGLINIGLTINTWIITPLEFSTKATWMLIQGFMAVGDAAALLEVKAGKALYSLAEKLGLSSEKVKSFLDKTTEDKAKSLGERIDGLKESFSNLGKTPTSDNIEKFLKNIDVYSKKAGQSLKSFGEDGVRINDAVNKAWQGGIMRTMSFGLQTIGSALIQGGDAFKDFGKKVLGIIGDMAIQMGEILLAEGLGINALKTALATLNGGAAIAAGASLIVLGGALKALSGGSPSSTAATSAGYSTSPPPVASMDTTAALDKKQAQIIINGDLLNTRESANHIAEILRQNSDITDYTIMAQGRSYIGA